MSQITEDTFEQVLQIFEQASIIDFSDAAFIDPYGMVSILEIGELLKSNQGQQSFQSLLSYFPGSQINIWNTLPRH